MESFELPYSDLSLFGRSSLVWSNGEAKSLDPHAELETAQAQMRDGIRSDIAELGEEAQFCMKIESRPRYYVDGVGVGKITEFKVSEKSGFSDEVPEYVAPYKFARSLVYRSLRESAIFEEDFNSLITYATSSPDPYYANKTLKEIKAKKESYPDYVVGDVEEVRSNIDFENQEIDRFDTALRRHSFKEIDKIKQARIAGSKSRIFAAIVEELRPDKLKKFIHEDIVTPLEIARSKPIIEQQILDEELARVGLERIFRSRSN